MLDCSHHSHGTRLKKSQQKVGAMEVEAMGEKTDVRLSVKVKQQVFVAVFKVFRAGGWELLLNKAETHCWFSRVGGPADDDPRRLFGSKPDVLACFA